jgi:hypothetical protein
VKKDISGKNPSQTKGGKEDMEKLKGIRNELFKDINDIFEEEYYLKIWFTIMTKYNYGMIYVDCIAISMEVRHCRVMEPVIYVLPNLLRENFLILDAQRF